MQHTRLKGSARVHLIVLIAALAAGLGLWLSLGRQSAPDRPAFQTAVVYPAPRVLPDFELLAGEGRPFKPADLKGRWHVAFIGFTHCPDVCPTTLADLANAEKRWSEKLPEASRPRILFVSVDPERDPPEKALEYARYFSPDATAASGTRQALEAFARSLGMVFMTVPLEDDDYTIDHSTQIALLDPEGRMAGFARSPIEVEKLADDLIRLAGAVE